MQQNDIAMPRKSAAELALAGTASELSQRPMPTADLTDLQKVYWVQISNALPADWFGDENKALLGQYVRTLSTLAFIDGQIDLLEKQPAAVGLYIELLKRREAQARLALTQATKMRLTQQARYTTRKAASEVDKPRAPGKTWEFK